MMKQDNRQLLKDFLTGNAGLTMLMEQTRLKRLTDDQLKEEVLSYLKGSPWSEVKELYLSWWDDSETRRIIATYYGTNDKSRMIEKLKREHEQANE